MRKPPKCDEIISRDASRELYKFILYNFADFLENTDLATGESLEDFVKRIAGEVHKKLREENGDTPPDID